MRRGSERPPVGAQTRSRWRGRRTWVALGIAVFGAAALLGYATARPLAPTRLRAEVEQRLSELLGGPVRVGQLRLSLGLGLRLEGRDIEAWPGVGGPALRVERAVADLRPFAHLTGQRRLSRLRVEGARLRVGRSAEGRWTPPPAAELLEGRGDRAAPDGHPDELLRPLIVLESAVRALLTRTLVADSLELSDGGLVVLDAGRPDLGGAAPAFGAEGIQLALRHRRLRGDTQLRLRLRLRDGAGERGSLEWEGSRSRRGELRIAVAATDLELEALVPFLRNLGPEAQLAGKLGGVLIYEAPTPGNGRLEVDLVGHQLRSRAPDSQAPWKPGALEASRAELRGTLSISPQQVRLEDARFESDALGLQLDGVVERPLAGGSEAQLALTIRDMTLAQLRHLIGWLPEVRREEAEALVAPLEVGHLLLLRAGGTATLAGWQSFLAGRTDQLPQGFVVDAELADAALQVGDDDRIEGLSGRLWWTGGRFELRHARARLNGTALPQLDLGVEGVSHLFAAHPEARRLSGDAVPLPGLEILWRALAAEEEDEEPGAAAWLRLEIDRLDHPIFLWPIRAATAQVEPVPGGVRVAVEEGRWAGVPVSGQVGWIFEPEPRVEARFAAHPPEAPAATGGDAGLWAEGRFELGPMHQGGWNQESAQGSFRARGGEVLLQDTRVRFRPAGAMEAAGSLDLARPDAAPFELSFALEEGDLSSLVELFGLPREFASGRLEAAGSLRGALRRSQPISRGLAGLIELEAHAGKIQRAVPAVVAIALASQVVNPFASREQVRFDRVYTVLELEDGRLSSDGLSLEGPDIRAFASGGVDLVRATHPVDVEVVLFLFRPVDSVLDKIPVLNLLLLGSNQNLLAAHFALEGPWEEPEARLIPLRSLTRGPGSLVFETLPGLVRRGLRAMGELIADDAVLPPEPPQLPAAAPEEP